MTVEEKRKALDEYCRDNGKCRVKCALLGGKWEHRTVFGCLDIDESDEEELDRALALIDGATPDLTATVIKDSGDRTEFTTGAVRDMHAGKGRMDLLPVTAIIELSKHCENGAIKYGERNVDKGIPQHSFIDSGLRHLFKYLRGDKDENHLVAALWNIAWAVDQEVNKPELIDLPNR